MKVGELKKMLDDIHDDSAGVIVKNKDGREIDFSCVIEARQEYIFKQLVQEEYTPKDGEPYTYTKAEYDERVVLVV